MAPSPEAHTSDYPDMPSGAQAGLLLDDVQDLMTTSQPTRNEAVSETETARQREAVTKALQHAFLYNHDRLESVIVEDPSLASVWRSSVVPVLIQSARNSKGSNIPHMASMMNHTTWGFHIAELVLQKKPEFVFELTNLKNSALHHAAHKGGRSIAELLIEHGAHNTVQNIRS